MAFLALQDLSGSCEVIVFPEVYKKSLSLIKKDTPIFVKGKMNTREDVPKILAEEIVPIEQVQSRYTRSIFIELQTIGLDADLLKEIQKLLSSTKGSTPVYIHFRDPLGKAAVIYLGEGLKVKTTDELLTSLEKLAGEDHVKIR